MLPLEWNFFGRTIIFHWILYFFGFCKGKFDIFWEFFLWPLRDCKSHYNCFEFTFSCFFLQAVEDSSSLPDAVLYSSIYLTKLAILDALKISHLVSWVKLLHWKWLDILILAEKKYTLIFYQAPISCSLGSGLVPLLEESFWGRAPAHFLNSG